MNTHPTYMSKTGWLPPVRLLMTLSVLCLVFTTLQTARAEDADPASRVARISYLKGRVFMQPVETDSWTEARINRPLTSGDQLWTEANSRSELQVGSATLQIDANTQLRLLELSDEVLQIEITQGLVSARVRSLGKQDTVELDTPNVAITVLEPGTYRVEVADGDDHTVIQVRGGRAEVAGEKQSFTIDNDEQLSLQGTRRLTAAYDDLPRMDEFDRWASERNQRADRVNSSRYVASGVIGYEDLDDYGSWHWYQEYGYVWQPTRVVSGWAPYQYGNWAWISPWGWTWVDDAPWGFAPFHYGRWTRLSNRWCWVPGPRTLVAVYAPAMVAWVGTPGISLSVNIGSHPVGWIPLGPREVYRPHYHVSTNYVFNINISNSLMNREEFERGYRRQPHEDNYGNRAALSVVSAGTFSNARPVHNNLLHGDNSKLQAIETAPAIRPETTSMLGGERRDVPVQVKTREVFARRQPGQSGVNSTITHSGVLTQRTTTRDTSRESSVPASNNIRIITPGTQRRESGKTFETGAGVEQRNSEPVQRPGIETSIKTDTRENQPRGERSTVTTPFIRPGAPAVVQPGSGNSSATIRTRPDQNTGADSRTHSTGSSTTLPSTATPSVIQRESGTREPRTATPIEPNVTERDSRNKNQIRDDAALRSNSERSAPVPASPAPTRERSEPASRESRSQPAPSTPENATSGNPSASSKSEDSPRSRRRDDRQDTR